MNNLVLLGVCNTCNNHFFSFCAKNRRLILLTLDLNGASQVAVIVMNPPAGAGDARDLGSVLVRKIPWRRGWQPTPVILPGKFHGQRGLVVYSPWGCKELDMT